MATHSSILAWIFPWIEGHKESDTTEHTLARSRVGPGHPIHNSPVYTYEVKFEKEVSLSLSAGEGEYADALGLLS